MLLLCYHVMSHVIETVPVKYGIFFTFTSNFFQFFSYTSKASFSKLADNLVDYCTFLSYLCLVAYISLFSLTRYNTQEQHIVA